MILPVWIAIGIHPLYCVELGVVREYGHVDPRREAKVDSGNALFVGNRGWFPESS